MFFDKSLTDFVSQELDEAEQTEKTEPRMTLPPHRHTLPGASVSSFEKVPKFKVVVLGEQSVGKTSIVGKFLNGTFEEGYQATIGVDFLATTLFCSNHTVRLQLWDTAGQERFHSLIPAYIRDCSAAIVVYDVTKLETFDWVDKWFQDVKKQQGCGVVMALVGNKVDLVQRKEKTRQVTIEEGQTKAKQHLALFYEASARTGYNIQHIFNKLTETCLEHHLERQFDQMQSLPGPSRKRASETAVKLGEARYENSYRLENNETDGGGESKGSLCSCG